MIFQRQKTPDTVDGSEIPFPTTVSMFLKPVVNSGINYLLTGAGFHPSTVCFLFLFLYKVWACGSQEASGDLDQRDMSISWPTS